MIKVGFSGTRVGMNSAQASNLYSWFIMCGESNISFHHGDCVGADEQAHAIVRKIFKGFGYIVVHPPTVAAYRAHCIGDDMKYPLPYLQRNAAIVKATDVLLAAPGTNVEEIRSGTWSTIRHAEQLKKKTVIFLPNGEIIE